MLLTVVSFLVVMSILVFIHELGHFILAKRNGIVVEEFGFGFPPRAVKLAEKNGTIYSLNWLPFGGFVRMRGEDDPSQPGSFASASKAARAATLLAGPFMNFILAILLFAVLTGMTGIPDPSVTGAILVETAPGSPAAEAGLQPGDRIVAVDGVAISGLDELQERTALRAGQPVAYEIVRTDASGETEALNVTMVPRADPPPGEGALGISISTPVKQATPWEAMLTGVQETWQVIRLTFQIPATLIAEGRPIGDAGFMGPVGIAATTGQVVQSALDLASIQPVIWFMALLSTALGITNLLPIPALDGGRLLFVLIELVRGRRVEPAQEGLVHLIGFGLLLVLVGVLTVREITALLTGTFPSLGL